MQALEAQILLKNLVSRLKRTEEGSYSISGNLTNSEVEAIKYAVKHLEGSALNISTPDESASDKSVGLGDNEAFDDTDTVVKPDNIGNESTAKFKEQHQNNPELNNSEATQQFSIPNLDLSVLAMPEPSSDKRLCIDFGTAMSKVTLVRDETDERESEEVLLLELGLPTEQETTSREMLVSSVFIDDDGMVYFGQKAVELSTLKNMQRLDNIKRYLSEAGAESNVSDKFNPTKTVVTYRDMILAYLGYLTWSITAILSELGEPRNLARRFAMPCFEQQHRQRYERALQPMLGRAQILADTYGEQFLEGIPLDALMSSIDEARQQPEEYNFVKNSVTEPLGVAGSLISWDQDVNALMLVIDVGAGTTDFSLFRVRIDSDAGVKNAMQIKNSSKGLTEAGNHIDKLLIGYILRQANITSAHENYANYIGRLMLDIREYKEALFLQGEVTVILFGGEAITVTQEDFLAEEAIKSFSRSLIACRDEVLGRVDEMYLKDAPNNSLGVVLTGGGADLPMVTELAEGNVQAQGIDLRLVKVDAFPDWLREEHYALEPYFPRTAVSIGGARENIFRQIG